MISAHGAAAGVSLLKKTLTNTIVSTSLPERQALPASPCVRNCCLDDNDVCMGCYRHLDEILAWGAADGDARRQILARAARRRR